MEGMAADDASPASAVRERYERMFKEKQRGSKGPPGLPGDPAAAALAAQGQAVRTAFQGSISSVFTKHLRWVQISMSQIPHNTASSCVRISNMHVQAEEQQQRHVGKELPGQLSVINTNHSPHTTSVSLDTGSSLGFCLLVQHVYGC